jgi:hypothetical protein
MTHSSPKEINPSSLHKGASVADGCAGGTDEDLSGEHLLSRRMKGHLSTCVKSTFRTANESVGSNPRLKGNEQSPDHRSKDEPGLGPSDRVSRVL